MGKAIGAIGELALTAGAFTAVFFDPYLLAIPGVALGLEALAIGAVAAVGSLLATALIQGPGTEIATRQAAQHRVVLYGENRLGGTVVYEVITGHQFQQVYCFAWGQCLGPIALYLDGKQVVFEADGTGQYTVDGPGGSVVCGGPANGTTYRDQFNNSYNFGGDVYFDFRTGTSTQEYFSDLGVQRGSDWGSSDTLSGNACGYLKLVYDANQFPSGPPQVRCTWLGRNTIYDPRSGTYGYTNNAALVIADLLMNPDYGFGYSQAQINMPQLIAAANVSDEQITLAGGGTESAYTINGSFDTSSGPGDILNQMLDATAFRISEIGGQIYIWPAAFVAPVIALDESMLIKAPEWSPNRSYKDLYNSVRGTYIAPKYPYSVVGNYYDSNGFDEYGNTEGNFDYDYEPTDYPAYAQDVLHGYASNVYLAEDGGNLLTKNLSYQFCNSIGQAQRVAKINLLRNRYQGSGTLSFKLHAYQLQPNDTFYMNFAALNWASKLLEISALKFTVKTDDSGETPPTLEVNVSVNETDPSIYEWSVSEQLSPTDTSYAGTISDGSQYVGPSALTLASGSTNAYVGLDGVVYPRILASWTAPDPTVEISAGIQVQWQLNGWTNWTTASETDVSLTSTLISGVVAGQTYNVRVRSVGVGGQYSPWVTTTHTVSDTLSSINSSGISPGLVYNQSNTATVDSPIATGSTAEVRIYGPSGVGTGYTEYLGSSTLSLPAATVTGLSQGTLYYVAWNTSTSAYLVTTSYDATNMDNMIQIGKLTTGTTTAAGTIGGGGRYSA